MDIYVDGSILSYNAYLLALRIIAYTGGGGGGIHCIKVIHVAIWSHTI